MSLIGELEPGQITLNILRVTRLFSSRPERARCGWDIAHTLQLPTSTTYSVLERLQELRWLESWRERHRIDGEPGRRMYRITNYGLTAAQQAFLQLEIYST